MLADEATLAQNTQLTGHERTLLAETGGDHLATSLASFIISFAMI